MFGKIDFFAIVIYTKLRVTNLNYEYLGWIRARCAILCELASTRDKILLGAIWRRGRCMDWKNVIQVLLQDQQT